MANAHRGEVTLPAGDQQYTLRFNNNALAALEEALGQPITRLWSRWEQGEVGVREVRAMLWAALLARHPRTTLTQAGDILDTVGLEAASQAVLEAVRRAFPAPDSEGAQGNPPAAGSGPGS